MTPQNGKLQLRALQPAWKTSVLRVAWLLTPQLTIKHCWSCASRIPTQTLLLRALCVNDESSSIDTRSCNSEAASRHQFLKPKQTQVPLAAAPSDRTSTL